MRGARWIEDRPWAHRLLTVLVLCGLVVALLLVSGCAVGGEDPPATGGARKDTGTPLDVGGQKACDLFARWQANGADVSTRSVMVGGVADAAGDSSLQTLDDKAELLVKLDARERTNAHSWTLAADAFAYECQHLGWAPGPDSD